MTAGNLFDLQIQSVASDGNHTPAEVVDMAKEEGVATIALTDHDTVAGVVEAMRRGGEIGVHVIPGVEFSVEERGIHMLGFGIDSANGDLLKELGVAEQGRIAGAQKMVENLRVNEGFAIEWDDVLRESAGSATVTRPHIVSAVMKRPENKEKLARDGVREKGDFFKLYLSNTGRNYVPRAHISAKDAIGLLHGAGGVAVWSHPVVPGFESGDYEELEKFLKELMGWGLDGVEVFNPSHKEDDTEFLWGLAEKHALLKTGGSDFHEKKEHVRYEYGLHSADRIGDFETYGFPTGDIVEKLMRAIEKRKI